MDRFKDIKFLCSIVMIVIFSFGCDEETIVKRRAEREYYRQHGKGIYTGTLKEVNTIWDKCHHPGSGPKCCVSHWEAIFEDGHVLNIWISPGGCKKQQLLRTKIGEYGHIRERGIWQTWYWTKLTPSWERP